MNIVIAYNIDKISYDSVKHRVSLVTTEYAYGNNTLVHLQIGKNFGIRLDNLLQYEFQTNKSLQNEQFLFKKAYNKNKATQTTRSTFEDKIRRFDLSKTVIEREILEEYPYTDKNGKLDKVQIVITVKNDAMNAVIDFKDVGQHKNFIPPVWLEKTNPTA